MKNENHKTEMENNRIKKIKTNTTIIFILEVEMKKKNIQ